MIALNTKFNREELYQWLSEVDKGKTTIDHWFHSSGLKVNPTQYLTMQGIRNNLLSARHYNKLSNKDLEEYYLNNAKELSLKLGICLNF